MWKPVIPIQYKWIRRKKDILQYIRQWFSKYGSRPKSGSLKTTENTMTYLLSFRIFNKRSRLFVYLLDELPFNKSLALLLDPACRKPFDNKFIASSIVGFFAFPAEKKIYLVIRYINTPMYQLTWYFHRSYPCN